MASLDAEEQNYIREVEAVKQWWTDSRWRYTRRPFTAEQIVAKRGTLKVQYPGNEMSKKVWKILEGRFKVRSPVYQVEILAHDIRAKKLASRTAAWIR